MKAIVFFLMLVTSVFAVDTDSTTHTYIVDDTEGNAANDGLVSAYPYVLSGHAEATIAQAITDAVDGDTIIVYPGTYAETLTVSEKLTIIGLGATITYNSTAPALTVSATGARIEGFTISNTYASTTAGAHGLTISGNRNVFKNLTIDSGNTTANKSGYAVYVTGDYNTMDSCWAAAENAGATTSTFGNALNITAAGFSNQFYNCRFSNAVNACQSVNDAGVMSYYKNCSFEHSADVNAAITIVSAGTFGRFVDCVIYGEFSGSANVGHSSRIAMATSTYSIFDGGSVYINESGTETGNVDGFTYAQTTTPFLCRNVTMYLYATAGYDTDYFVVSDGCTVTVNNCSFESSKLDLNTTGKIKYTDVLNAGSQPIQTDSSGYVKVPYSRR